MEDVADVIFDEEVSKKILKGVETATKAIGSTLGPMGSNVMIERPFGSPSVVHDGVSVSKEVHSTDKFENMACDGVREGCEETEQKTEDGTTVTALLTGAVTKGAFKNIAAGANSRMLRRGMEVAVKKITDNIKTVARAVKTDDEIEHVAITAAQDEKIGQIMASAIKKLGRNCIIAVEESKGTDIDIEYKEGMQFDKGWVSPYFADPMTGEASVEDAWILITDLKFSTNKDIVDWASNLQNLYTKTQPPVHDQQGNLTPQMPTSVVIIASEISGIALATMLANQQNGLNILAIQAPGYGEHQRAALEDIAVSTGGKVISSDLKETLSGVKLEDYGHARKVVSTKNSTVIFEGEGKKEDIEQRVKQLKNLRGKAESDFETEKLNERIAKLSSGVAIVNVGGLTTTGMRERKEACIDAKGSIFTSLAHGIVPGGETALLKASYIKTELTGDEKTGAQIVVEACRAPFKRLMENSGYDPGMMLERLASSSQTGQASNYGVDVLDGEVKDLIKAGVIDSALVPVVALQVAVEKAGSFITTASMIKQKDEVPNS
jgi:chaperonin GroEL